ncbi:MAG TPA: 3-hydroxyacyl-ACP dehydratase [Bacteroidia bacterium]|jgi:3-hydroxyacyl-[acyl-carrier-protein] dehydratase|nr:3-hydroxyacyl-ACP dehydratase [Bacteroidia bacterium]
MLLNDFFKINAINQSDKYIVSIELNAEHAIFKGHFPNKPITPGVCLTQMVKECLEKIIDKKLMLVNGSNLKFMAVLNPLVHPKAIITISFKEKENQLIYVDSSISSDETTFFTFKGSFR